MSASKAKRRPKAPTAASSSPPKITRAVLKLSNRILNGEKFSSLAPYAKIADAFEVPLWVMFVPNLARKTFADSNELKRLIKHVENFIAGNEAGHLREARRTLIDRVHRARATVHLTATALWTGDSDLESHAAETLRLVARTLDEVNDDLVALRDGAEAPQS